MYIVYRFTQFFSARFGLHPKKSFVLKQQWHPARGPKEARNFGKTTIILPPWFLLHNGIYFCGNLGVTSVSLFFCLTSSGFVRISAPNQCKCCHFPATKNGKVAVQKSMSGFLADFHLFCLYFCFLNLFWRLVAKDANGAVAKTKTFFDKNNWVPVISNWTKHSKQNCLKKSQIFESRRSVFWNKKYTASGECSNKGNLFWTRKNIFCSYTEKILSYDCTKHKLSRTLSLKYLFCEIEISDFFSQKLSENYCFRTQKIWFFF